MKCNELDVIRTFDGKEGTVLEIYDDGKAYLCEFDGFDIRIVKCDEIKEITFHYK